MRPSWADLPDELLALIAEKPPRSNEQYVYLRAVCKAWRRALPPSPRHVVPPIPWLLLHRLPLHTCRKFGIPDSLLTFFDLTSSKTLQLRLPFVSGKYICGSSFGWLVLEHHPAVSLLNPITGRTIDLPSLNAPPFNLTARKKPECSNQGSGYNNCILKAILSCNPTEPGCIVVVWFSSSSNWELAFFRKGDTHWNGLKKSGTGPKLVSFTFHNNSLYTLNSVKEVFVYDLQNLPTGNFHSKFGFYVHHRDKLTLVEGDAESGGPLIVKNTNFVYKWFDDCQKWRLVHDIGRRVIFLNPRHSINLKWDEQRENEVYYHIRHSGHESFHVVINRVNLETRLVSQNCRPMGLFSSIPGLPLWITPSLT